jgi:hypothetical protein
LCTDYLIKEKSCKNYLDLIGFAEAVRYLAAIYYFKRLIELKGKSTGNEEYKKRP